MPLPRVRLLLLVIALLLPGCLDASSSPSESGEPGADEGKSAAAPQPDAPMADPLPGSDGAAPSAPGGGAEDAPAPEPGTYDLHVRVDASRGPHGRDTPAVVDRGLYGVNIADWRPQDFKPEPDPEFLAYLEALRPGVLRWPAGHSSQSYQWERAPEADGASRVLHAEDVDAFVALARAVGAEPLLAVNLKTGTPEAAADLVRYANVERGHDIVWWQLGNEPDHKDGLTSGPEEYARDYLEFARAMRAVDPDIRLVGAEIMTGAHVVGANGRTNWMEEIARIAGHEMDALSWHYYPLDSGQQSPRSSAYPTVEHLFQEHAPDWRPAGMAFVDEAFPALERIRDEHAPGAGFWVTEIAQDSGGGGAPGIADSWAGALWSADVLGRMAAHEPEAVVKFVFRSGDGHRYTLLTPEGTPRPEYYAYWLMAQEFGERIVHVENPEVDAVAVHAALRDDGALAVMLVNKREEARDVRLTLENFAPAGTGSSWLLLGDAYDAKDVTLNGETLHVGNVREGPAAETLETSRDGVIEMPPLSIRMLVLTPQGAGG